MQQVIKIHPRDNVAVALCDIPARTTIDGVTVKEDIGRGHKLSLTWIDKSADIIKYGYPIGSAVKDIEPGVHVHTHNVRTKLSAQSDYTYQPDIIELTPIESETFKGFLRADGSVAVRNEIWIIPTVGCVNAVAQKLVQENQHLVSGSVDGLYTFPHPFGCSQMGDDHAQTRKLLAALALHPNAAAVLILGLGCENNTMDEFKAELGDYDRGRIRFMVCQEVGDEYAETGRLLAELVEYARGFSRVELPIGRLVIGMKCGGSDGLSGITANPVVGLFSDMIIARGGTTILTEVPEMFGAEGMLMSRCRTEEVYNATVRMIDDFKRYFTEHGQVVYENPSPGNKSGGITTLEDKSLGCVQKGGTAPISDILGYGDRIRTNGLTLLSGPGNDLVSTTAMTAAGAHIILFTTGRGTPFGAPVPTIKISTNTELFERKPKWIDFNAGTIAEGETHHEAAERLLVYIREIAEGRQTRTEEMGFREISIFKQGVVL